jgi:hypothetical protein
MKASPRRGFFIHPGLRSWKHHGNIQLCFAEKCKRFSLTFSGLTGKTFHGELRMPGIWHTSAERGIIEPSMEMLGKFPKTSRARQGGIFHKPTLHRKNESNEEE